MQLELEDGTIYQGTAFGADRAASGELVFNTGMVGYCETLTDPSYCDQILIFTYPLIGNYGVFKNIQDRGLALNFESSKIHAAGVIINYLSHDFSHTLAVKNFQSWLLENNIPAICDLDTRALTKKISQQGAKLAKIETLNQKIDFINSNEINLVAKVSRSSLKFFDNKSSKTVLVVDTGVKYNIIRCLLDRKVNVQLVPWDYDYSAMEFDGIMLTNGPGNPKFASATVEILKKQLKKNKPIFGICLGHQLLAVASGAKTFKMKFGHRSQNQPCVKVGTKNIYITSQNHGYAVDEASLPGDWKSWFFNANDGSNEGIQHTSKPFFSVQFHPEACPGPTDTLFLFDEFVSYL